MMNALQRGELATEREQEAAGECPGCPRAGQGRTNPHTFNETI